MKLPSIAIVVGMLTGLALSRQAFPVSGQSAKILYALNTLPIYVDAAGHRAIGSVTPGTPLQGAGGPANGFQPFKLGAWSQQGNTTTIVAAQGQRIVTARLTAGAAPPKILSSAKDDYGNVWNRVELSGFAQASGLTSNQNAIRAQASAPYRTRTLFGDPFTDKCIGRTGHAP